MSDRETTRVSGETGSVETDSGGEPGNENRNTRLYFWGGVISALISWVAVPLVGLVAVYCGYHVRQLKSRLQGNVIAGIGGLGVLTWVVFLATM